MTTEAELEVLSKLHRLQKAKSTRDLEVIPESNNGYNAKQYNFLNSKNSAVARPPGRQPSTDFAKLGKSNSTTPGVPPPITTAVSPIYANLAKAGQLNNSVSMNESGLLRTMLKKYDKERSAKVKTLEKLTCKS